MISPIYGGVPGLVHMDPKDEDELADMMYTAMLHEGPSAIRYPRGVGPGVQVKDQPVALEIGKAEVLRGAPGAEVVVFGLGAMMPEAERLAGMLEGEGFSVAVVNARFAKPVDRGCVDAFGERCGLVVTFEDHVLAGGFGSAVLETLNSLLIDVPVVRVGWPDEFIEHGRVDALREQYGLTAETALLRCQGALEEILEYRQEQRQVVSGARR